MNGRFKSCILMAAMVVAATAHSRDVAWDGKTYIPVGLKLGSDLALTFPEPVYTSAEIPDAFSQEDFGDDGRTYIITAKRDVEQRVFFKGQTTGTIYIARFSNKLPYAPTVNVVTPSTQSATAAKAGSSTQGTAQGPAEPTSTKQAISSLMRSMMQGNAPQGYDRSNASYLILDAGAFTITAQEVWQTNKITGVIVKIRKSDSVEQVKVHPADIQINAAQLGDLRMFGADRWDLTTWSPQVAGYLIFSK